MSAGNSQRRKPLKERIKMKPEIMKKRVVKCLMGCAFEKEKAERLVETHWRMMDHLSTSRAKAEFIMA